MMQTVKTRLKACSQEKKRSFFYQAAFKPSHSNTHWKTRKLISFSGKAIRALLTMSYFKNEKIWYKNKQRIKFRKDRIYHAKGQNTAIINREMENSILAHADQIRLQGEYEGQNEEEISTIPSVNDLLEQPLQNETSEDEIMHDQVG